jgi:hypothetical protein
MLHFTKEFTIHQQIPKKIIPLTLFSLYLSLFLTIFFSIYLFLSISPYISGSLYHLFLSLFVFLYINLFLWNTLSMYVILLAVLITLSYKKSFQSNIYETYYISNKYSNNTISFSWYFCRITFSKIPCKMIINNISSMEILLTFKNYNNMLKISVFSTNKSMKAPNTFLNAKYLDLL